MRALVFLAWLYGTLGVTLNVVFLVFACRWYAGADEGCGA